MNDEMMMENEQPSFRRYVARPKFCQFCVDKNIPIDYKQVDMLRRFISDEGKIRPRRQTGTCAKHQRALAVAVKRARHLAFLPYVGGELD
jgi:small subunit ribosomal protein S18